MLPVVLGALGRAFMYGKVEESALEEPKRSVIGDAESSGGFDDLVENRLEASGACNGAKDAADGVLLSSKVRDLTSKLRVVGGHAGHARSLGRPRSPRPSRARRHATDQASSKTLSSFSANS
jgi:hypothetical protein